LCATAKTHMYKHTLVQMRVRCETIKSVDYERGDRHRAIAPEYRYTCVHRPRGSPGSRSTSHSSLYIEIALRPNRTHAFAFHRRCSLRGSPLQSSFLYLSALTWLTGWPDPIFVERTTCPPSGSDLRSRGSRKIVRARDIKLCEVPWKKWSKRRLFRKTVSLYLCKNCNGLAYRLETKVYVIT